MNKEENRPYLDFQKISTKEWWNKIDEDLKDQSRDSLYHSIVDGLKAAPFYHFDYEKHWAENFNNLRVRDNAINRGWKLGQKFFINAGEESEIRKLVKESQEQDTQEFIFVFNELVDIGKVIADLKISGLTLQSSNHKALEQIYQNLENTTRSNTKIDYDILSVIVNSELETEKSLTHFYDGLKKFEVDTLINSNGIINGGGDESDEVIYTLSLLNEILSKGIKDADIYLLRLNSGSNFFLQIAKIRAIRKLAEFILSEWGIKAKLNIEIQSCDWNKSAYERFNNILRLTSESFSAVVGGCDILTISGFEDSLRIENSFTHRNARNISHLLKYESHLDKVSDMAAGSYYIESLTNNFAEHVWERFREIESEGGLSQYLGKNPLKSLLSEKSQIKKERFSSGKIKMVGTNAYPNPEDKLTIENIQNRTSDRISYDFEKIRCAVEENILSGKRKRPKACLLKLGKSRMRFARASFATNFLESAGIEISDSNSIDIDFTGFDFLVICSGDEEYLELASKWTKQIKGRNSKSTLILAGNPENKEDLMKSGVEFFIHLRAPLGETLIQILKSIGIETA